MQGIGFGNRETAWIWPALFAMFAILCALDPILDTFDRLRVDRRDLGESVCYALERVP